MKLDIANLQGVGRRNYQQDFFALSDAGPLALDAYGLDLVLADGMGGALDGAVIARETVDFLKSHLKTGGEDAGRAEDARDEENSTTAPATPAETPQPPTTPQFSILPSPFSIPAAPEQVLAAIEEINTRIYERYRESGGTTLIVARITEGELWFASVGDSNVFLCRAGRLFEMNRRHEFLFDLYERVLDGLLSLEDAQNNAQAKALSSFIGCGALRVDHSRRPFLLQTGDTLIICSDGVSDTLTPAQMLEAAEFSAQECCAHLECFIEETDVPGQDNYTAIVVKYEYDCERENEGRKG